MQIDIRMRNAFKEALGHPENFDNAGHINWNFMDADCYCAKTEAGESLGTVLGHSYMPQFDALADLYEATPVNVEAV